MTKSRWQWNLALFKTVISDSRNFVAKITEKVTTTKFLNARGWKWCCLYSTGIFCRLSDRCHICRCPADWVVNSALKASNENLRPWHARSTVCQPSNGWKSAHRHQGVSVHLRESVRFFCCRNTNMYVGKRTSIEEQCRSKPHVYYFGQVHYYYSYRPIMCVYICTYNKCARVWHHPYNGQFTFQQLSKQQKFIKTWILARMISWELKP